MNTETPRTNQAVLQSDGQWSFVLRDCSQELERELTAVTEQRDRLAEAMRSIKNELGVPQPEYPAPVANAVKIADEALQSLTTNEP